MGNFQTHIYQKCVNVSIAVHSDLASAQVCIVQLTARSMSPNLIIFKILRNFVILEDKCPIGRFILAFAGGPLDPLSKNGDGRGAWEGPLGP